MTKRSLFEFQFAFNNCIRLIFIGMQSGSVNSATGSFAHSGERKWGSARWYFHELLALSRRFRGSPADEGNKSRATAFVSSTRSERASDNGFRLRAKCDLFMREASSTRRFALLRASFFSKAPHLFPRRAKRKYRTIPSERAFTPYVIPRGVSRDLHQTPKEYSLMNLAAIFSQRKVSPTQYLSL